ncbi:unnamed protein product [Diamesa serratosioi]
MTHKYNVNDPKFVDSVLFEVKACGEFDKLRKECLSDVDTKPAYQNLYQRVEESVESFLDRQRWKPDLNKNKMREELRSSIIRAGFLESGVSRIVDQVVDPKMSFIHETVEEILYNYAGVPKPSLKAVKHENGILNALEVQTDLLPTDLEAVSPDSDKKSNISDAPGDIVEEEVDEEMEIVEDEPEEDFESPAFEPLENLSPKNENSQTSDFSAISGLTSQDSIEDKSQTSQTSEPIGVETMEIDSQLSQISSANSQSLTEPEKPVKSPISDETIIECRISGGDDAQMPPSPAEVIAVPELSKSIKQEPLIEKDEPKVEEKSQFDLKKEEYEFTGTERKSIEEEVEQKPDSLPPVKEVKEEVDEKKVKKEGPETSKYGTQVSMEIDHLYDNETTDSSEIRMEIDLKDETTRGAVEIKVEDASSQDSSLSKSKRKPDHRDSKKDTRDKSSSDKHRSSHKSSSSSSKHHSSSSKSRHDHRSSDKSSSDRYKKSSNDKDRTSSSSSRRDKDKERTKDKDRKSSSSKDDSKSRTKDKEEKPENPSIDDHQQEKSASRRRRSTDHDSNDGHHNAKPVIPGVSDPIIQLPTTKESNETPMDQTKSENSSQKEHEPKLTSKVSELIDLYTPKPVVVDEILSQNLEIAIDSNVVSTPPATVVREERSKSFIKCSYLKPIDKTLKTLTHEDPESCLGFPEPKETFPDDSNTKYIEWFNNNRESILKTSPKSQKSSNNNYLDQKKMKVDGSFKLTNTEETTPEQRATALAQQQRYDSSDLYKPFIFGNRRRRTLAVESESAVPNPENTEVVTT